MDETPLGEPDRVESLRYALPGGRFAYLFPYPGGLLYVGILNGPRTAGFDEWGVFSPGDSRARIEAELYEMRAPFRDLVNAVERTLNSGLPPL